MHPGVSLPVDIFSEIIQNLDDLVDKSTIHSLSRCSLSLLPLCQRRIFHTIFLDSSGRYADPAETHAKMMRLEENFRSSPYLATYVRSFEIWLPDGGGYSAPHSRFFQLLSKIAPSLTHVQKLKVYGADIHSKDASYVDWTLIRGSSDPDIQDSGIAIEKLLVGGHLRHLETRGILGFPFTLFLDRCRVVDVTDDRAHTISIHGVEMFRDASLSNVISSVRRYTLSHVECTDRMMSVVGTCAHEENHSKPLPLNFTKMTTLTVAWTPTDRDIKETKNLILLGRFIEILSISGE